MLVGILSGLIVWLIVLVISKKTKNQFKKLARKLFHADVSFTYPNQEDAMLDIKNCFIKSSKIQVMTLRGKSFLHDQGKLKFIVNDLENTQELFYLTGNSNPSDKVNFAEQRAEEISA